MITSNDPHPRKKVKVLDGEMSYVDVGQGDPIIFLHGNPTSSYLWRNVITPLVGKGRCLAPDLIGMGDSMKIPGCEYRFVDHVKYLDAWFEALELNENITLVIHDWGSALGFHRAFRYPDSIRAIVYMEALVQPVNGWSNWPDSAVQIFQALRSEAGEEMILDKNVFVENILPGSVIRKLSSEEMDHYRKPFLNEGESRRPTLTWPRQIPIDGEPADVHQIASDYSKWMAENDIPKLYINAEPGAILIKDQREFCRSWKNQTEVTVPGIHFIQEDSPDEISKAISEFLSKL